MDEFFKSILTNLASQFTVDQNLVMKFIKLTLSQGHHINITNSTCDVILEWKAKDTNHLIVMDSLRACMPGYPPTHTQQYYFRTIYRELLRATWSNGVYTARVKCSFEDVFALHLVLFEIWKNSFLNTPKLRTCFEDDVIIGFWSHVICGY